MKDRIRLGISRCLLGEKVRYDGGHKLDRFLRDTLGAYVEYIPVCPEVECGLGTPRESMILAYDTQGPRLLTSGSGGDHTGQIKRWAEKRLAGLGPESLEGFIFKSGSPSCGMEKIDIHDESGAHGRKGPGIFAGMFIKRFPLLPAIDEVRLHDLKTRENFIEAVFTMRRWRDSLEGGRSRGNIVDFHTRHKLLIMSHGTEIYRETGHLIGQAGEKELNDLYGQYQELLVKALRLKATTGKNTNVLRHAAGYLKRQLSADEKQELSETIEHYRRGTIPLIVPITQLGHYVRKYGQPYLKRQYYINPNPLELRLRNHE